MTPVVIDANAPNDRTAIVSVRIGGRVRTVSVTRGLYAWRVHVYTDGETCERYFATRNEAAHWATQFALEPNCLMCGLALAKHSTYNLPFI